MACISAPASTRSVNGFPKHDLFFALHGASAKQLIEGYLLDLFSQLDLREHEAGPATLREALKR